MLPQGVDQNRERDQTRVGATVEALDWQRTAVVRRAKSAFLKR